MDVDDAGLRAQANAFAESVAFMALVDWSLFEIRGGDARSWLNGQVTNDIQKLLPGEGQPALALNAKGKILGELWTYDLGESLYVSLPSSAEKSVIENFDKYIIMEDVEIAKRTDPLLVTVQGPRSQQIAESIQGLLPSGIFLSDRLGTGGIDLLVPPGAISQVLSALEKHTAALAGAEATEQAWELARVRLGIPRYGYDFGDDTLPQEAGLRDWAVSFSKGCYLGQEAVAMLEHRGRPPRRLVKLEITADEPIMRDTPLQTEEGEVVGRVTSAVREPDASCRVHGLGYVKRDHVTMGNKLLAGKYAAVIDSVVDRPQSSQT